MHRSIGKSPLIQYDINYFCLCQLGWVRTTAPVSVTRDIKINLAVKITAAPKMNGGRHKMCKNKKNKNKSDINIRQIERLYKRHQGTEQVEEIQYGTYVFQS